MHKLLFFLLAVPLIFSDVIIAQSDENADIFIVDTFEDENPGELPSNWYNQRGTAQPYTYDGELRAEYKYRILKEGNNHFLRYDGTNGKHLNFPLLNKEGINIFETPVLSWKWRILDLPDGANEDDNDKNDVAASIYVVFDMGRVLFKKVPKSIRYTWSSTLPKGTDLSKFYGNQKIIVVGSGNSGLGEWQDFERNVVEDYRRLFGEDPPAKPIALLILSDGDSTNNHASADYDDILFKE